MEIRIVKHEESQVGRPATVDLELIDNDGNLKAIVEVRPEFVPAKNIASNSNFIIEIETINRNTDIRLIV
jgi:hypothetical protein